jgi:hypothetical protein
MNGPLLFVMLTVYVLGSIIMFLLPEELFSKGSSEDRIVTDKGYYRKLFLIGGAVLIVIILLVDFFFISAPPVASHSTKQGLWP